MRRLCRFFLILILACTVVGCSDEEEGGMGSLFWAEPKKEKYNVGDPFTPKDDVDVYTSSDGGEKQPVPINQVTISLARLPYNPEELVTVQSDTVYKLGTPGTNIVVLEYEGMSTSYRIDVLDSAVSGGSGIVIKWEGDK